MRPEPDDSSRRRARDLREDRLRRLPPLRGILLGPARPRRQQLVRPRRLGDQLAVRGDRQRARRSSRRRRRRGPPRGVGAGLDDRLDVRARRLRAPACQAPRRARLRPRARVDPGPVRDDDVEPASGPPRTSHSSPSSSVSPAGSGRRSGRPRRRSRPGAPAAGSASPRRARPGCGTRGLDDRAGWKLARPLARRAGPARRRAARRALSGRPPPRTARHSPPLSPPSPAPNTRRPSAEEVERRRLARELLDSPPRRRRDRAGRGRRARSPRRSPPSRPTDRAPHGRARRSRRGPRGTPRPSRVPGAGRERDQPPRIGELVEAATKIPRRTGTARAYRRPEPAGRPPRLGARICFAGDGGRLVPALRACPPAAPPGAGAPRPGRARGRAAGRARRRSRAHDAGLAGAARGRPGGARLRAVAAGRPLRARRRRPEPRPVREEPGRRDRAGPAHRPLAPAG